MTVIGTCLICKQPILDTEGTGICGSFLVCRIGFTKFEQYQLRGHDRCADELLRRLGITTADADPPLSAEDLFAEFSGLMKGSSHGGTDSEVM